MYGHCRRQAYGIKKNKKYYYWRGNCYIHFVILELQAFTREMAVKTKVNLFEMSS